MITLRVRVQPSHTLLLCLVAFCAARLHSLSYGPRMPALHPPVVCLLNHPPQASGSISAGESLELHVVLGESHRRQSQDMLL